MGYPPAAERNDDLLTDGDTDSWKRVYSGNGKNYREDGQLKSINSLDIAVFTNLTRRWLFYNQLPISRNGDQ
jgi:hypothetical protein